MPLLTQEQIAERLALYTRYSEAIEKFEQVSGAMPDECPPDIELSCRSIMPHSMIERRVAFVVRRAWPALRKAVLADALKEVDEAEAAVRKFEAGEDTDAPE